MIAAVLDCAPVVEAVADDAVVAVVGTAVVEGETDDVEPFGTTVEAVEVAELALTVDTVSEVV